MTGSRAPASLARACAAHRRACAARSSGSASLARRLAWLAHWRSVVKARASGAYPCCASNSRASRSVSAEIVCRREENSSISPAATPRISRPCPSARRTHPTPNSRDSADSITAAAIAAAAPRCSYSARESSVRYAPSRSRITRFKTRLWMCSCGSPSRLVCCANEPTTNPCASSHRPVRTPSACRP